MKVVLDTTVFENGFNSRSAEVSLLKSFLARVNAELCIPKVVYDEALNRARKRIAAANSAIAALHRLTGETEGCLDPGETKNDDGREVTMTPLVRQLLQECVRGKRPGDFVLTRKDGKAVEDFRGAWRNATTAAGIPGLLFHDLRRTAVRNMIRAGIPERVAMQISGHKTRSILDRYNVVSQTDIQDAVNKLSQRTVRVELQVQEVGTCSQATTVRLN